MNNVLLTIVILGSVLISSSLGSDSTHVTSSDAKHVSHWSYAGESGPSKWSALRPAYSTCSIGERQSPIDVQTDDALKTTTLKDIFVSYGDADLEIINNGHTIQVNSDGTSKALLGGKEYTLLQFHFHSLSEHTIDGKYSPMEVHLVHQSEDGELAVIGVMIEEGKHNNFMQKIFKFMPKNADGKTTNAHKVNANDILPKGRSYYHYMGSLTTPPCTQIVQWYVLKDPISISSEQLAMFNSLYKGNYRPVQEIHGRKIISK